MPDLSLELGLHRRGIRFIAGVDEVGRGPLAGPVVAAAVLSALFADDFSMEVIRSPMMYKSTCCHIYPESGPVKYKLCQ